MESPLSILQSQMPILRPVRDEADLRALHVAAALDGHIAIAPNYIIEKGGEIVGYAGFNSLPTVQGWLHTGKLRARDTLSVFNHFENLGRMQGWKALAWMVPNTGTMVPYMAKMGYSQITDYKFGVKGLL